MVDAISASTGFDYGFSSYNGSSSVSANSFVSEPSSTFSQNNYQSIFYVNDVHGQLMPMDRINNASAQFDAFVKSQPKVDDFRFSAGDIFIGSDKTKNKAAVSFLNLSRIQATTIGNHEFDTGATIMSKLIEGAKAIKLMTNAFIPSGNPLGKQVVKSSVMIGKTGEKYGLVAAQSPTLVERMKDKTLFEGIKISDGKNAYSEIQKEVNKLENQGINKIVMLSHSGYEEEKKLAQNVSGVDVIIGGHSHDLILDIKEGENLQYSPKGEPVIITQAGRDGKNFGVLNVEYDENGVVKKAQNNVFKTSEFNKNMMMTTAKNVILGVSPVIGKIGKIEALTDKMNIEENPYCDVFMDIVRKETGVDIALMNSANFRGMLDKGDFTERDIEGIFPFKNKMCITEISEKNLIEALNFGGKSVVAPDLKPSVIQVSGMKYTLSKDGNVVSASVMNKDGKYVPLNVKNPSDKKFFKTAYDDYLFKGGDGFKSLSDVKLLKMYDYDKDRIVINYFKAGKENNLKSGIEINIVRDGRLKVLK